MKKQGKKWMLVALALPLVGCKNDSVSEIIDEQTSEQTGSETQTGDTEQLAPEDDGNTAPVTYTVTFDSKGGVGEISSQTVESGKTLTKPAEPTRNEYVFVGWYSDETFTNKYDFNTPVTSSFTLYAKWVEGTEITSDTVASVIAGLSGEGPHTLLAIGEWTDLSTLAEALKDESKKVNLDLSGVEGLETIGNWAFKGCSSLTSITIPASVKTIGGEAFRYCENLAEVTFGEESKLETIDRYAFSGCSKLTSITIPASVKTIESRAFKECSGLASINIPASVVTIWQGAFDSCKSLTEVTFAEESKLETIDSDAFFSCSKLTSITIPASVKTIRNNVFNACENLTTVTFGEGSLLTTIGNSAFFSCSKLESITIPASVTAIGNSAFRGCFKLTAVTMEATEPPTLGSLHSPTVVA